MFRKKIEPLKIFNSIPVSEENRSDFNDSLNRINITRAKYTTTTFIVMEALLIIISFALKRIYLNYIILYAVMLSAMSAFYIVFKKFGANISYYRTPINFTGLVFAGFILCWCALISLLDLSSGGQFTVYAIALFAIAVTPLYKPASLALVYLIVHVFFLAAFPHFDKSGVIPFNIAVNSTTAVIFSWLIAFMRYRNHAIQFNNELLIQGKNNELEQINNELKEANKKLEKISQIDGLTGVYNRYMFDYTISLDWERCRRQFAPLSLLMIDIDFFKIYNDHYGHQAGDECLRQVARIIVSCVESSSNIVARYGGEEFAVIFPYMKKDCVYQIGEKMRKMVEERAILNEYSPISRYLTISLGVYTILPSDQITLYDLIKNADVALYKAKKQRNNIVVA